MLFCSTMSRARARCSRAWRVCSSVPTAVASSKRPRAVRAAPPSCTYSGTLTTSHATSCAPQSSSAESEQQWRTLARCAELREVPQHHQAATSG